MTTRRDSGSGSIAFHKDSGLFQGRIYIGQNGKRIRKSVYAKTRREAQLKLNALMAKVEAGSYVEQSAKSLASWLDEWMKHKKTKLKPNTLSVYMMLIDTVIKPGIGDLKLKEIRPMQLQTFFNELTQYAPASLQKIKNILNPAFRSAVDNGLLHKNPMAGVELPKLLKAAIRSLTEDEVERLCVASKGYRLHSAIKFALATGLRINELLALRWDDFNVKKQTLSINKTLIEVKDENGATKRVSQQSPKTDSSNRIIPLNDTAMTILADHMLETGTTLKNNELIFATQNGTEYCYRNFNRTLASICDRAGIQRITAHALRHTFASLLSDRGADMKALSEILGHSKASTTINVYVHPSSSRKENVVSLLDGYRHEQG